MTDYFRPVPCHGPAMPGDAIRIANGWTWATHAIRLRRDAPPSIVSMSDVPGFIRKAISAPRASLAGLSMDVPRLMGILNVTPDSFSDGGLHADHAIAEARAVQMIDDGADIIDVGGESTRPGASEVPANEEVDRIVPVMDRISDLAPVSVDTRKAEVAKAALSAGARMINDVSAMSYDAEMATVVAEYETPICLMHAQGDPATMQTDPRYDDAVLDVYDSLDQLILKAEASGISRDRIIVDPGIGFGKTLEHNLALVQNLSIFHGLGVPILLGASRKRFIGTMTGTDNPADRVAGSVSVALAAIAQGVQIVRVHDTRETRQAMTLWNAVHER